MEKFKKIKKVITIALGFGLSTYLLMSGFAILDEKKEISTEQNATIK
jgi:hypothetical protein